MKKLFLITMVCAVVVTTAGYSQACCIYNNTNYPLKVEWVGLLDTWTISPSNHQCTNGTGGNPEIYLLDGLLKTRISEKKHCEIDSHGWLSIYKKESTRWRIVSKDKNGNVKYTYYLGTRD